MNKSQSIKELAIALAGFQSVVGNVTKDATNPFFKSKYASLENIVSHIEPLLAKAGLSYAQFPNEGSLTTILMHSSGEWIEATADLHMKDQTPQGQGSAITYMRRYALSSVLGIATEDDDDGNAATAAPKKPMMKTANPVDAKLAAIAAQKKEIQKLCDAKALAPLLEKADYEKYILDNTGLTLGEDDNTTIIERLKAL